MFRPQAGAATAAAAAAAEPFNFTVRENRHQRRFLKILLEERTLIGRARELLKPDELADPELQRLYDRILCLGDAEFQQLAPEEMAELYPEVAPAVRGLLLEDLHEAPPEIRAAKMQYEIALIKEALKHQLQLEFKRLAGQPGGESALRRFTKVRDELKAMKSVPESRSAAYNQGTSEAHMQRMYDGQVPFPNGAARPHRKHQPSPSPETSPEPPAAI